jgi:hypothetical protein
MLEIRRYGHNTVQYPEDEWRNECDDDAGFWICEIAIEHHTHWWTNSNPTYWQHDKLQLHTLKHNPLLIRNAYNHK